MTSDPIPWIAAVRASHDRLVSLVEPLGDDQIEEMSYAAGWTIAQVLSHLGSQAEIFGLFLEAGLTGQDPPGREVFGPIWDAWNAKSPRQQVDDSLTAGAAAVERFEGLDEQERRGFHLSMFGMEMDLAGVVRMRLGEHAVHTWDVAVALDPSATVSDDAVELLVDTLDALTARSGKGAGHEGRTEIETTGPSRRFLLDVGEKVALTASQSGGQADVRLPAEALVRLVYGRLDPEHTPKIEVGEDRLGGLRGVFPGF